MTDHTPPTDTQLDDIAARAASLHEYATLDDAPFQADADQLTGTDVPALLAVVRRQRTELAAARDRVAELETYAYGCGAEGCVLPHSSWCDAAKKTAAANNGCTCGEPWTGHPQPHAMHCWTVNPPRAEVEEMRRALAELRGENAKLVRWHREDKRALAEMRAAIERLRSELTKEQRLHGDAIDDRDRAQDAADKLAYAIASEEVIGEHTADNCPWANALDLITPKAEVDRLLAELAAEKAAHRFTLRQRNNRSNRLMDLRNLANAAAVGGAAEVTVLIAAARDTLAASRHDHDACAPSGPAGVAVSAPQPDSGHRAHPDGPAGGGQ